MQHNTRRTALRWINEGKNAVKWTWLSCHDFADNEIRLHMFALPYSLGDFLPRLPLLQSVKRWLLTGLKEKPVKIGEKVVTHAPCVMFQMARLAIPHWLLKTILRRISRFGALTPAPI